MPGFVHPFLPSVHTLIIEKLLCARHWGTSGEPIELLVEKTDNEE